LIQKINILDEQEDTNDFERLLKLLYADGKLDEASFKALLEAHRNVLEV
jgi:hypothetical protein